MRDIWRRRAALGVVVVVIGVILGLSTLGATAFGGPCTTEICSVPGTEGLLLAGVGFAVTGAIVCAVALRGIRRNSQTRKGHSAALSERAATRPGGPG